jgi:ABC-type multidrug transport system ATPase subunit
VADKRAGGFSLGMSQRLGVAVAMLGARLSPPAN